MASGPASDPPTFLIVAGPNGSGKSSFYSDAGLQAFGLSVWIINPDLLSVRIVAIEKLEPDLANVEAVRRIEAWLDTSISAHQSIGVETVLSTSKYRRLVEKAKDLGFSVRLIYVYLNNPDLNVERVKLRVQKGGHSVPENKIRTRYERSLMQLSWFWKSADEAWLFDNSGRRPFPVARKSERGTYVDPGASDNFVLMLDQ